MKNDWKTDEFKATTIKENMDSGVFNVPKYQRGIVWSDKQRAELVDTIKKGLPFGSLLLYTISYTYPASGITFNLSPKKNSWTLLFIIKLDL